MCVHRRLITMTTKKNSSSSIQAVYDLCRATFAPSATSPTSNAIQKLSSLLGCMQERAKGEVTMLLPVSLSKVDSVTTAWEKIQLDLPMLGLVLPAKQITEMCIFCFPTSSVIPLHDHPGMTVLSKVLYGSLHVKAYDWVEPAVIRKSARLAKLAQDKVLTAPCSTTVLYPKSGGNLHCFTAVTPCAVLDILSPPYNELAGRKCSYYSDYPFSTFSAKNDVSSIDGNEEDYSWLVEVNTPDDLYMCSGTYAGPPIQK
ncbi:hypothetical protein STAS_08996 [Striga asiatica]|uniref:cysteine dioxygenase n=1 Tax=Striga asiatica TaxID=4170 RepID=A0A5A7PJF6_STRAF|nr:hypothetical protein STAS_08996 [Striga asiatica]